MNPKGRHNENYWMDLYQQGNEKALSYFFDAHYRPLCYFAGRLIQNNEEAKDIVSNCFVKLWNSERRIESSQNIKAFLYISCRNACLNYLKQLNSRNKVQTKYYEQLVKEEEEILYQIIRAEVLQILAEEVDDLPEKCRQIFKMIYFEHKKTHEIASVLNTSEKSVRYYKARSIEILKAAVLKKGLSNGLYLALLFFLDNR